MCVCVCMGEIRAVEKRIRDTICFLHPSSAFWGGGGGDVKRLLRNTSAEDFPLHNLSFSALLCESRRFAEGTKQLLANRAREASAAESSTNCLFALKWTMKLCFAAGPIQAGRRGGAGSLLFLPLEHMVTTQPGR